VLKTFPTTFAQMRTVAPGSYVHIQERAGLRASVLRIDARVLGATFRPGNWGKWQGVISQYGFSTKCGFGMFPGQLNIRPCTSATGSHSMAPGSFRRPRTSFLNYGGMESLGGDLQRRQRGHGDAVSQRLDHRLEDGGAFLPR